MSTRTWNGMFIASKWSMRRLLALALLGGCEAEPPGHGHTALHLHFEGAGSGEVTVSDAVSAVHPTGEQTCSTDCTLQFTNDLQLRKIAGTVTSLLARFSCESGCTTDDTGALVVGPFGNDDLDVTVRFTSWEEAPLTFAISGEFAPDGDLVIGTRVGVAKVSLAGEPRWVTQLASGVGASDGSVSHVSVAQTGETYVAAGQFASRTVKLAADGQVGWTADDQTIRTWDATPDGDVIELTSTNVLHRRRRTDGADIWSTMLFSTGSWAIGGLAVAPDGGLYIGAELYAAFGGSTVEGHVLRFTSDGASAGADWIVPADFAVPVAVAIDRTGAVLVHTYHLLRLDPVTGTALYDRLMSEYQAMDFIPYGNNWHVAGATATSSNQALSWIAYSVPGYKGRPVSSGTALFATSPTGEQTWISSLPAIPENPEGVPTFPNVVTQASCDDAGHCALFGPNMPATIVAVP